MSKFAKPFVAAVLALFGAELAGCGGGGVSLSTAPTSPDSASAAGRYDGTTSDNRSTVDVLLADGSYWSWYSAEGNYAYPGGLIQGSGSTTATSSTAGTFSATNGKDFNLEGAGVQTLSVSANFVTSTSLSGTLSYTGGGSATFASSYNSDYLNTPSLATIAGTYTGYGSSVLASATYPNQTTTLTLSSAGAISGLDASGCSFSGTASPHSGANVYDLQIQFAGGACALGTTTVSGIAVHTMSTRQLRTAGLDSTRSAAALFTGTKP